MADPHAFAPSNHALRVSALDANATHAFELTPDAQAQKALAKDLDLSALRKLRFAGTVKALGTGDWQLDATLGATFVQPCAVTLAPVTTRIDTKVTRVFQVDYTAPDTPEAEMPDDDTIEPLGAWIDPHAVMIEALSLAVPDYPRVEGAEVGAVQTAAPGVTPMRDEDAKPFAPLAALKARMEGEDD